MTTKTKWIAVIMAGFIAAGLLGAQGPLGGFWGAETTDPEPSGGALAGLIGAGVIEGIAFGVGLAWLAFGREMLQTNDGQATATYLAVAWALVSWAPHTSFHQSIADDDYGGLAAIELGFHVTLVIGALIIASFVWRTLRVAQPTTAAAT